MAATRLIALHAGKGRSVARSLNDRTDYAKNPEKTAKGELVTSYGCDPYTVDEEFMLQKREYYQKTGRSQQNDVIAYQIRQSFKPGEVTPEEANRLGRELAMRFTKGKYAFIVATHTDRAHVHNHIVYNSVSMDGTKKFRDFRRSGLALQKLSDLICLENGLSVITPAPYSERKKRTLFPKRESFRDLICGDIDVALSKKPEDFAGFLRNLEEAGYEIKYGKHISVKGKDQKVFLRLDSLREGYQEKDIRAIFESGKDSERRSGLPRRIPPRERRSMNLLIDVQKKLQEKGAGYARWATVYNLKQMSKTLLFLRDHGIKDMEELQSLAFEITKQRDNILSRIRADEERLKEIAELKKHIINYVKTRNTYEAYRKAGYSKKFFEAHREELTIHKAAKEAFDEFGVRKLPKVKDLNAEYSRLLAEKRQAYAEYRKIRDEARDLAVAERNINGLYEAENRTPEREHTKENQH
ncbi:MAG: relaxase/mobilization nuclease domain-containing protein [Stomatobaculum sp.]|nr:relaxase/mobilization nuclease domain-containing protein [Stomatobaculum sp.]